MLNQQTPPMWNQNGDDDYSQISSLDDHQSHYHPANWMLCDHRRHWSFECDFGNALSYSSYIKSLTPVWADQLGSTSGQWVCHQLLGYSAVGIKGIYGCTVVLIVSEKGGYISHIWENPVFVDEYFNSTDDNSFMMNTFNALQDGTAYAQSVTALIGTDQNPGVLNAIYAPEVFVFTLYTTCWDRQKLGISTTLRYQIRAEALAKKIAEIIPGSGGNGITMGYTRTSQQTSSHESGVAGRVILEMDPLQAWITVPQDPNSAGLQLGRWRLWVEDQLVTYQDFWLPHTTAPGDTFQPQDSGYISLCSSCTNSP